jgi:hypothetical protein
MWQSKHSKSATKTKTIGTTIAAITLPLSLFPGSLSGICAIGNMVFVVLAVAVGMIVEDVETETMFKFKVRESEVCDDFEVASKRTLIVDGRASGGMSPESIKDRLSKDNHEVAGDRCTERLTSGGSKTVELRLWEKGIPIVTFKCPIVAANIDVTT